MNIWLINHYSVPIKYYYLARTSYFAKHLLGAGHNVRVIAASTVHNSNINLVEEDVLYREEIVDGIPYTYIKCHQYKGNGLKRIANMFEFAIKLERVYKQFEDKPDVVLGSSLTPFACVEAIRIARYFNVKSIVEIRDLWPENFVARGIFSPRNPLLYPMYLFEKKIYESADNVIFTFEGGYEYIKERGWDKYIPRSKVHYINNGVDLEEFDYNKNYYTIDDNDLNDDSIFKVIYTGSIRYANNLGKLIDVAKCINNPKIKFLVWGRGNELDSLKKRVINEHVSNFVFKGYVEKKYVPYITSHADLNIAHYTDIPVTRFGISPNKIFDYMASGKPTIIDRPAKYDPIVQCEAGFEVKDSTIENIAKEIERFAVMDSATYSRYCRNAHLGAEKYNFKNLTMELLKIMTGEYMNETSTTQEN